MQWKGFVTAGLVLALATIIALAPASQEKVPTPKEDAKLHRGGRQTPFPKIIEAIKGGRATVYKAVAAPAKVTMVPKRLSMWGNNQYGCCVSSESAFSIAAYSTYIGIDEIFVTEATLIKWARDHGWLNGADLLSVIEDMQRDGIKDENGVLRKAGKPSSVNYSDEDTLKSAIAQGPVSIAIDADALPSGAGSKSGWSAFGGRSFPNTDHCVGLAGYGPTSELFQSLNTTPPPGMPANGYLLFTWNTIGVVDHKWLMNTCVEAWVRNPTVTNLDPPPPPVSELTVSMSNVSGAVSTPVKFSPSAKGGTSPYIFLFDYGDGMQDAAGSHSFKTTGNFKVTVTAVDSTGKIGSAIATASIGATPVPPGPGPIPGGLMLHLPQDTPAGNYHIVQPSDLDEIQRRLDAIRGLKMFAPRKQP